LGSDDLAEMENGAVDEDAGVGAGSDGDVEGFEEGGNGVLRGAAGGLDVDGFGGGGRRAVGIVDDEGGFALVVATTSSWK